MSALANGQVIPVAPAIRTASAVRHGPIPHSLLDAPRPLTRAPLLFGLAVVLVFVVGFGAWSTLARLAEAALASGVIKVEGTRRTLQHLEGGIVREILVRDGSRVEAGQVLVRLDTLQPETDVDSLRAQRWAQLAQIARLVAELADQPEPAFPSDLRASTDDRARNAMAGERALFEARRLNLASQVEVLRARVVQQQAL
ncbi:MAG: biotin/lipoyl-binding protein, partial [Proteobacteria bacterium]|nr:biotin/lipoyl-binding protein [Pseudomonadota bacterium]